MECRFIILSMIDVQHYLFFWGSASFHSFFISYALILIMLTIDKALSKLIWYKSLGVNRASLNILKSLKTDDRVILHEFAYKWVETKSLIYN